MYRLRFRMLSSSDEKRELWMLYRYTNSDACEAMHSHTLYVRMYIHMYICIGVEGNWWQRKEMKSITYDGFYMKSMRLGSIAMLCALCATCFVVVECKWLLRGEVVNLLSISLLLHSPIFSSLCWVCLVLVTTMLALSYHNVSSVIMDWEDEVAIV